MAESVERINRWTFTNILYNMPTGFLIDQLAIKSLMVVGVGAPNKVWNGKYTGSSFFSAIVFDIIELQLCVTSIVSQLISRFFKIKFSMSLAYPNISWIAYNNGMFIDRLLNFQGISWTLLSYFFLSLYRKGGGMFISGNWTLWGLLIFCFSLQSF